MKPTIRELLPQGTKPMTQVEALMRFGKLPKPSPEKSADDEQLLKMLDLLNHWDYQDIAKSDELRLRVVELALGLRTQGGIAEALRILLLKLQVSKFGQTVSKPRKHA